MSENNNHFHGVKEKVNTMSDRDKVTEITFLLFTACALIVIMAAVCEIYSH